MSFEKNLECQTAEELFQFLKNVPEHIRKEMPVHVHTDIDNEYGLKSEVRVEAFDVTETEGCREIGLNIIGEQ